MNRYEIRCTKEQTRKAIELGAPIEMLPNYTEYRTFPLIKCKDGNERPCVPPTAEEMIGWMEEKGVYFSINNIVDYVYEVWYKDENGNGKVIINSCLPTRKEATLTAIDASLEYLSNKAMEK